MFLPDMSDGKDEVNPLSESRSDEVNLLLQMDLFNSMNAICKSTGKRWRTGGRQMSEAVQFLSHLIARLDNTVLPPGRLETLMTDHGGEVLSTSFTSRFKQRGCFT